MYYNHIHDQSTHLSLPCYLLIPLVARVGTSYEEIYHIRGRKLGHKNVVKYSILFYTKIYAHLRFSIMRNGDFFKFHKLTASDADKGINETLM